MNQNRLLFCSGNLKRFHFKRNFIDKNLTDYLSKKIESFFKLFLEGKVQQAVNFLYAKDSVLLPQSAPEAIGREGKKDSLFKSWLHA